MSDLIGFFDSGVGGVSVLHEARRILPNEHFLFFGDNANAPYGPKPLEEIRRLSAAGLKRLLDRNVKAVVIACNTATAAYAHILRSEHPQLPVVAMEPALKPAHFARHGGKIIVLATETTLRLEKFERLMANYGADAIRVVGEGLVELVEAGKADSPEARAQLEKILSPYQDEQIDGIVLGCTHYPFLQRHIQSLFPESEIFDGRFGTVQRLKALLEQHDLCSDDGQGSVELTSSGGPPAIALMERLMASLDARHSQPTS